MFGGKLLRVFLRLFELKCSSPELEGFFSGFKLKARFCDPLFGRFFQKIVLCDRFREDLAERLIRVLGFSCA